MGCPTASHYSSHWINMSDADWLFPPRGGKGSRASMDEQRFIRATDRKSGHSRSVQVVQLRRGKAEPVSDNVRAEGRGARGEAWQDGFKAKPPQQPTPFDTEPSPASKPAPQVGHVVDRAPSLICPLPVQLEPVPARKARGRPRRERTFADPFAADESGANCFRCGYLVEAARENRGKLTCAACG